MKSDRSSHRFLDSWKCFWKTWHSENTFIFRSVLDVFFGTIVLLVFPIISLWYVYRGGGVLFSNYGFPLISISAAALYDTYGRYKPRTDFENSRSGDVYHTKLVLRSTCNALTLLIAALICGVQSLAGYWWIPCIPLVVSAILLCNEAWERIKASFILTFGGV